jgi:GH25 family lysozyme M1 (1,4-beta-N-acetylmuramidase)
MIHGVDVSHYQGKVDFHALKDNADFVIIKSTYGNGYIDPSFTVNRDGARAVGLSIGFYHYAYPQFNQPQDEATWFTKNVSCQPGEIICLDFEESYPDPVHWCRTFLDKVSSNMGFKPLIYLNLSLIRSFDWTPVVNAGYGLWIAHYDGSTDQLDTVPWEVVAMKQYSDKGNVAGMNPVDLDMFYGDVTAFKKYGNPPPPITTVSTSSTSSTSSTTLTTYPPTTIVTTLPLSPAEAALKKIHDIIYGSGFWWTKLSKIKALLPK